MGSKILNCFIVTKAEYDDIKILWGKDEAISCMQNIRLNLETCLKYVAQNKMKIQWNH